MPGTSKTAARTAARPAGASAANIDTSARSMSPAGKRLMPSDWRYRFSVRSQVCQRTVAGDIFSSRLISPPSRVTARCRARPSPRATSRPLILLDDQLEDLLRLQAAEVLVREPVEGFLERVSHVLRHRVREQELAELRRRLRRDRLSAVDPFDHDSEAADNLEGVRRRTVAAVSALDDVQEPRRVRVVAVELQVDDAVRQVHRNHGLRTREIPRAMLLERT